MGRGDLAKAEAQLTEARDKAEAIASELLTTHPELRAGSFSNAIEEYVSFRLMEREILRKTELDCPTFTTFIMLMRSPIVCF